MATTQRYDVAIVGGGLGGLSLAIQTARAGRSVLLLEKEDYPKHRVCGEYISMESWPHLQRLGLELESMNLPRIHRLEITDNEGRCYPFHLPLGGFGISRFTLDHLMYQTAQAAGVEVLTRTKVSDIRHNGSYTEITTATGRFEASAGVLAYGKRSNLDIKWDRPFAREKHGPLHNWVGVKYHAKLPFDSDLIQLHNFHNGYCGISMIEADKVCICYLMRAANLRNFNNDLPETEAAILKANPKLGAILSEAEMLYGAPLVISQVSFSAKQPVEQQMMMVGDAAGMIAPLCGNGMSMALHGSKLAFEALEAFFAGKMTYEAALSTYAYAWKSSFARRLMVGRTVQRFFGSSLATRAALQLLSAIPGAAGALIRQTHGRPF